MNVRGVIQSLVFTSTVLPNEEAGLADRVKDSGSLEYC